MAEKLEQVFEYRMLLSKARELLIPLSDEESTRLDRLGQRLPTGVPPLDDRDPLTTLSTPLAAEYVHAGRFQPCSVRNLSGAGLALVTTEPPVLGQRLLVHVRDQHRPIEYTFPARVVARVVRGVSGMSVAFEGLPTQRALAGRSASGVWATDDPTPTSSAGTNRTRGRA
jgi:hypothetical protein